MEALGRPTIVALLGVPGSGKNVVARRLSELHRYKRLRFTDPLRDMLRSGFTLTGEHVDGPDRETPYDRLGGCNGQRLFKGLTHWAREMSGLLLPEEFKRRADLLGGLIVADDLQRLAEAEAVWKLGGIVIRIVRVGHEPRGRQSEGPVFRQSQICADLELEHDGDAAQLIVKTDALAHELRQRQRKAA